LAVLHFYPGTSPLGLEVRKVVREGGEGGIVQFPDGFGHDRLGADADACAVILQRLDRVLFVLTGETRP